MFEKFVNKNCADQKENLSGGKTKPKKRKISEDEHI